MEWRTAAVHSLMLFVIPQLEGIRADEAKNLSEAAKEALQTEQPNEALTQALENLHTQIISSAV